MGHFGLELLFPNVQAHLKQMVGVHGVDGGGGGP
tara:strand:- start:2687 stop:2788 length:102 start_codon:yes stop_codon:yes gene_type:complete